MSRNSTISPNVAAHVLWQERAGGYPAGSFTTALLQAWWMADPANSARLAAAFPEYGAAIALLRTPSGTDRLRAALDGCSAPGAEQDSEPEPSVPHCSCGFAPAAEKNHRPWCAIWPPAQRARCKCAGVGFGGKGDCPVHDGPDRP